MYRKSVARTPPAPRLKHEYRYARRSSKMKHSVNGYRRMLL